MSINELDKQLLELLTLQVPWYMVCGEFHGAYGGATPLARRIKELETAGLVVLRNNREPHIPVTAMMLEQDARENNCYEELEETRDPEWDIMATDAGFSLIEGRLDRQ